MINNELGNRIISALIMVSIALGLTVFSPVSFAVLVLIGALLLSWEWGGMTRKHEIDHITFIYGLTLSVIVAAVLLSWDMLVWGALAVGTILVAAAASKRREIFWNILGLFYIALPAISLVWIRKDFSDGLLLILLLFIIVWSVDIASFAFGKTFGGPRLAPSISPKKTWSGFFGGIFSGVVMAMGSGYFLGMQLSLWQISAIAIAIGVASQLGDLGESAVKRHFHVKDSSQLIPGHGGLFDRVDGLIAASLVLMITRSFSEPFWMIST